jgi:hypothetical protein
MTERAGYSGTPLPRKLGIVDGTRLLLLGAPDGFELGPLPGVELHRRAGRSPYDVVLLFAPDRATLVRRFAPARDRLTVAGGLWACWPKRASGVATDLNDNVVRAHGLATGLVDVKVAAIDATWSGMKFVVRLRDRPARGSA